MTKYRQNTIKNLGNMCQMLILLKGTKQNLDQEMQVNMKSPIILYGNNTESSVFSPAILA